MLATTTQSGTGSWWETTWGKISNGLDFVIDDWIGGWSGQNQTAPLLGLGGNPYPEQTAPLNPQPTEKGFEIGNNAPTYALGLGVLLLGVLAFKAVK